MVSAPDTVAFLFRGELVSLPLAQLKAAARKPYAHSKVLAALPTDKTDRERLGLRTFSDMREFSLALDAAMDGLLRVPGLPRHR